MAAATPPANARRLRPITDNALPPESEPPTPLPDITTPQDGSLARKLAENYSVPCINAMALTPPGADFHDYC
jgi:hypothetical protein